MISKEDAQKIVNKIQEVRKQMVDAKSTQEFNELYDKQLKLVDELMDGGWCVFLPEIWTPYFPDEIEK